MDTSKTYIQMCDYPEIQDLRKHEEDWFDGDFHVYRHTIDVACIHHYFEFQCFKSNSSIWLPTQAQLQGMITGDLFGWEFEAIDSKDRLEFFYEFASGQDRDKSMEQLWLAFVMKEKFNKQWDGEKWIK